MRRARPLAQLRRQNKAGQAERATGRRAQQNLLSFALVHNVSAGWILRRLRDRNRLCSHACMRSQHSSLLAQPFIRNNQRRTPSRRANSGVVVVTLFSALDVSATPDAASAMTRKVIPSRRIELPNERVGKVEMREDCEVMSRFGSIQMRFYKLFPRSVSPPGFPRFSHKNILFSIQGKNILSSCCGKNTNMSLANEMNSLNRTNEQIGNYTLSFRHLFDTRMMAKINLFGVGLCSVGALKIIQKFIKTLELL